MASLLPYAVPCAGHQELKEALNLVHQGGSTPVSPLPFFAYALGIGIWLFLLILIWKGPIPSIVFRASGVHGEI